jgi:predicted dithiol-disulfide oxidoreductase (DUF899 family)
MKSITRTEWKKRRAALLVKEKALTRARDKVTAQIRKLSPVKLPEYVFQTPKGPKTLAQLFGKQTQLLVYHFMLGPGWGEGCPSCSFWADHFASFKHHLPQRDVAFKVISRATLKEIEKYKKRLGWKFDWVSSAGSKFNLDLGVSEGKNDESPGFSIFIRDGKDVYHSYFTTGRGLEVLNSTYGVLDLVPKGRNEKGLEWPMQWVKRNDEYAR